MYDFKQNAVPGTKWVYVSLGALGTPSKGAKPAATPPGTTCVEPLGLKSPVATQLKIDRLPVVYVFDEKRKLSAYGRIDELPWLLSGVNRLIAP